MYFDTITLNFLHLFCSVAEPVSKQKTIKEAPQKSEKSVHSLVQRWQEPKPENQDRKSGSELRHSGQRWDSKPGNQDRKSSSELRHSGQRWESKSNNQDRKSGSEQRWSGHKQTHDHTNINPCHAEVASDKTHSINSDKALQVKTESLKKDVISDKAEEGSVSRRTDSGYETSPPDNGMKEREVTQGAKVTPKGSHANRDITNSETNTVGTNQKDVNVVDEINSKNLAKQEVEITTPLQVVNVESESGVEDLDMSGVVYRKKSRPSISDVANLSLCNQERLNSSGESKPDKAVITMNSKHEHDSIGHPNDASLMKTKSDSNSNTLSKGSVNTAEVEESCLRKDEDQEEEMPVVVRRRESEPQVSDKVVSKTNLPASSAVNIPHIEVHDSEDSKLLSEEQIELLYSMEFKPIPELSPLTLEDSAIDSLSELSEILKGDNSRSSVRKSELERKGPEGLLGELKEILKSS